MAQISIKSILEVDLKELQQKIAFCKEENTFAAKLPVEYRKPLMGRIDAFLDHAESRILSVDKQARDVESQVKRLRCLFGEGAPAAVGDCISTTFFGPFGDFAANFLKAHEDNARIRLAVRVHPCEAVAVCHVVPALSSLMITIDIMRLAAVFCVIAPIISRFYVLAFLSRQLV